MTAMMELADENLKVDILKVISMLMNLKKVLNGIRREVEDMKRMKGNI